MAEEIARIRSELGPKIADFVEELIDFTKRKCVARLRAAYLDIDLEDWRRRVGEFESYFWEDLEDIVDLRGYMESVERTRRLGTAMSLTIDYVIRLLTAVTVYLYVELMMEQRARTPSPEEVEDFARALRNNVEGQIIEELKAHMGEILVEMRRRVADA